MAFLPYQASHPQRQFHHVLPMFPVYSVTYLPGCTLLQKGQAVRMPHSRPMPVVGPRCHELRVRDAGADWRIVYRLDSDAVVILEIFAKKTRATPKIVIDACTRRLGEYDHA